jgi:hypothetical protein
MENKNIKMGEKRGQQKENRRKETGERGRGRETGETLEGTGGEKAGERG